MKKTILEQLQPNNIPIERQIDLLCQYLMENFEREFGKREGKGEGAIGMAIRLLNEYKYRDGVIGKTPDGKIIKTNQKNYEK